MKKLIGGNFKMNLSSRKELEEYLTRINSLVQDTNHVDVLFSPQMCWLETVGSMIDKQKFQLGAQNIHQEIKGAYTGECSPLSLQDLGVRYAIIGHGERRSYYNETDSSINAKLKTCLAHSIRPVLCIGETKEQREQGLTTSIIRHQLLSALDGIEDSSAIDVAYEPLWAIGTGLVASNEDIKEVHGMIRSLLDNTNSRILYGGSSNDKNAADLIQIEEVNGFLVGGASLNPESFATMIQTLNQN